MYYIYYVHNSKATCLLAAAPGRGPREPSATPAPVAAPLQQDATDSVDGHRFQNSYFVFATLVSMLIGFRIRHGDGFRDVFARRVFFLFFFGRPCLPLCDPYKSVYRKI